MNEIVKNLKKNKYTWLVVVVVLIAGIFFRTYKYHELMRFNADQGRDAELVSNYIEGKTPIPLLGPKAGGTAFDLGPIFYYFQIVSAKIFGNYPDKMAYPDLLTGILAIPLLYFFLRKYFDLNVSLVLSAIFALSEFAIRWARFAWNPNSTPFWVLIILYALHEVLIVKSDKSRIFWAVIAGLSVGIGVQLHSMLLFFLPITFSVVFFYLLIKKNSIWKYFFVIFSLALFLNVPQFIHEYSTNGANTKAFFEGVKIKQDGQRSLAENFLHGNSAFAQIVPNILTGYEISDDFSVDFGKKHRGDAVVVILGALFTLGGLILAIRYFKKEKDKDKRIFLLIIAVYLLIAYLIFIKLSFETSVRMYLVIFFIPFILLGFWLQFIKEKMCNHWKPSLLFIGVFFISVNLYFIRAYFIEFESFANGTGSVNISTLGEMEKFSMFVEKFSKNESKVYISGNKKFFFINFLPIRYLVRKTGTELVLIGRKEIDGASVDKFFYIARDNKLDDLAANQNYVIVQDKKYGKFTILLLEKRDN